MSKLLKNQGYSLLEILVVMALIITLSAIIVPKYSALKDSAKITEVKYGLTKLYRMEKTFHLENGYYTGDMGELDLEFDSKAYRVGFSPPQESWGAINSELISNCTVDTANSVFKAGSSNDGNKLINFSIDESGCLLKIKGKSSDCNNTIGSKKTNDCISSR